MTKNIKTELEWPYAPEDFFEAPYEYVEQRFNIKIEKGMVKARLSCDSLEETKAIKAANVCVQAIFQLRSMQNHQPYTLEKYRTYRVSPTGRSVTVSTEGIASITSFGNIDIIQKDADGNVVRDTKKERIDGDKVFIDNIVSKAISCAVLQKCLTSYVQSLTNPSDELTYLYEIRDAMVSHFGDKNAVVANLPITLGKYRRFGEICNVLPLKQGRHRGKPLAGLRDATLDELTEARLIAKEMIEAFANNHC